MSWKEVLKPSLAEFGPADIPPSRLSACSDGPESQVDVLYENGDKLYCGLELSCLPGPSGSGSTYELVCVDEWLKTRTESLSSMDMDVAMKSDGIDPNYLSDSGVSKENPNLSELDQFLTPKGAIDLCIVNDVCGSSRKRLVDLVENEDSGLLLTDDLLLKEGASGKKPLFMIETLDEPPGKDLKDEDGLCRRGSWADSLELGKDKVNWESMSNTSHRSHELEKDVDFPEFNFVPSFDPLCSMECSLPVEKDLEEAPILDKDEDLSVIPIVSKPEDLILQNDDPVIPAIEEDSISTPTSSMSLLKNPVTNPKKKSDVAVIAISTNKLQNVTQIVIQTPQGDQQVFEGKTSELVQATSNLDKNQPEVQDIKIEENNIKAENSDCENDSGSEGTSEDQLAMDLGSSGDKPGSPNGDNEDGDDDQTLIDALAEIGIKVESMVCVPTSTGSKMWVCPENGCGKTYPRLCMVRVHILSHYGLRPFKCDYEGCYWSFYTYFKLKRHKATHLKRKDFECLVEGCGRRFTTVYNLKTHSKLHKRPAGMVCSVPGCKASFQTRRKLENHLKDHDICHAPYRCHYCGKAYYTTNSLSVHLRSHEHKEEELRCQYQGCGKLFDQPCRLRAHMRMHTGDRPFICDFEGCTWAFSTGSKLRRHQQKHTDERKYKCTFEGCNKAFLRSEHLREHLSTHMGSKNFHCPVTGCGVSFTAKSSLYVHMKKHTSPQNQKIVYLCPYDPCDRKYLCRSSLRHHMAKAHTSVYEEEEVPVDNLITFITTDDDQDILLDGSALVASDGGVTLESEHIVLSTINPADIMLAGMSVGEDTMLSNAVLPAQEECLEEEGMGCARTNLPLPLVPRRLTREANVLAAPPATLLSDDLFSDPMLATAHSSGIEFQMMLDSRQRDFSESTINLRDLE